MVILNVRVDDSSPLANMKRELARIKRVIMGEVAQKFAEDHILPHFGPSNQSRYHHEQRNKVYRQEIKTRKGQGQGRYVDNVLTGASKRQVMNSIRITKTQYGATIRASVPTYFAKPFVGRYTVEKKLPNGKVIREEKVVTRQPDKVKELTAVDARTRTELANLAIRIGQREWKRSPKRTKVIRG